MYLWRPLWPNSKPDEKSQQPVGQITGNILDEKGADAASLHQYYDGYFGLYNDKISTRNRQPLIDTLKEYFVK